MNFEEVNYDDNAFDLENEDISIDETTSIDTEERDRKKRHELYRRLDPDYYSFKKMEYVETDEGIKTRHKKIRVYSSPCQGRIRNASTGIRENEYVGARTDNLFFVVKDVALFTKTATNDLPRKLYYKNPEEFERHHHITLPRSIKEKWFEKNQRALAMF